MRKSVKLITILSIAIIFGAANMAYAQKEAGPWNIPAKYKTMKSTVKLDDASVKSVGKDLYNKHCKSCHGTKGIGDGPKAAMMKTKMPSLATKEFHAQTEGEIYYQSIIGRDEMPNFEKKIADEDDKWAVVQYVRTLK